MDGREGIAARLWSLAGQINNCFPKVVSAVDGVQFRRLLDIYGYVLHF